MELLRGVLVSLLARLLLEALARWGPGIASPAVEVALADWLAQTLELACVLASEAMRSRRRRHGADEGSNGIGP